MSANSTAAISTTADPDRASWTAYLGLGLAAALLGAVTSIGVWLFNQAFNAINSASRAVISRAPGRRAASCAVGCAHLRGHRPARQ